jgi:hypothetical protein
LLPKPQGDTNTWLTVTIQTELCAALFGGRL